MKSHLYHWWQRPISPFTALLTAFTLLLTAAWIFLGALDATPSLAAPSQQQAITLQLIPFATGLSAPVKLANAGDDRLFVVEQGGVLEYYHACAIRRRTGLTGVGF